MSKLYISFPPRGPAAVIMPLAVGEHPSTLCGLSDSEIFTFLIIEAEGAVRLHFCV